MRQKSLLDYLQRFARLKFIRRLGFRTLFFVFGTILAQTASLGYFLYTYLINPLTEFGFKRHVWLLFIEEHSTMFYMWIATTLIFGSFSWILGYSLDHLMIKLTSLEHAMILSRHFEQMKRQFLVGLTDNILSPVSVAIEFVDSLGKGLFGSVNEAQRTMSEAVYHELTHLNVVFRDMLSTRKVYQSGLDNVRVIAVGEVLKQLDDKLHSGGRHRKLLVKISEASLKTLFHVQADLFLSALEQVIAEMRADFPRSILEVQFHSGDPRPWLPPQEHEYCHLSVQTVNTQFIDEAFKKVLARIDSVTGGQEHASLDLFVAKSVFEWHGSELFIDKAYEGGMRLLIAIPIAKPETNTEAPAA